MSKHKNINFKYLVFSVDLIVVKHTVLCCNARREVCYHCLLLLLGMKCVDRFCPIVWRCGLPV